jgi:triosephosphate isomerase (TIM)
MQQYSFFCIANWKMQMSYNQTLQWCHDHRMALKQLTLNAPKSQLVLCPSFTALTEMHRLFADIPIALGAQTCSPHSYGAYTGEVDAASLAQVGCTYGIVGHSERRTLLHETDAIIAQQALRLLEQNITPIVCVGETKEEKETGATETIIKEQLLSLLAQLAPLKLDKQNHLIIAYEPVWAIGGTTIPSNKEIASVFEIILQQTNQHIPLLPVRLIYGGNVNENNIQELFKITHLGGFLLGRASLDFQKLQNIVTWVKEI